MERDAPHVAGEEPEAGSGRLPIASLAKLESVDAPKGQNAEASKSDTAEPPLAPPPVANWLRGGDSQPKPAEASSDSLDSRAAFEQKAAVAPIAVGSETVALKPESTSTPDSLPLPTVAPEATSDSAKSMTLEKMAAKPVEELLALPSAVVAKNMLADRSEKSSDMSDGQLMELAKTIQIDGIPLQQIYESKQIDKAGLKAVVEAYLRGASVEKQLAKEIVEKEKRFELDPFTRKQPRGGGLKGAASRAPGKILDLAQTTQKMAVKLGHTVVSGAQKAQESASEGSDGSHWAGIAAIVIIYSLILILWLTK